MSLRLRLLLLLAPLFVLGAVAADVSTYTSLQSFLVSQLDNQIVAYNESVRNAIEHPGGPLGVLPGTWGELVTPSGDSFCLNFGPNNCATTHPVLPAHVTTSTVNAPKLVTVSGTGGVDEYRVYAEADSSRGLLIVAAPLTDLNAILQHLLLLEVGVTGGVTIIVVVATWLIVRRSLRPLERMATTARSIAASDLSTRVQPSNDTTEVGRLGLALNTMLHQLEEAWAERQRNEQRLRHFVSDASHELRTPLTSMQGYAELIQRAPDMERSDLVLAMRRMEEETQRMGILVDDLLLLARLDQGRPLQRETVDLEALVTDACADARAADPTRAVTARVAAPLVVTGDEMRLRQVLGNLVRNALVHTPDSTPIEVVLRADGAGAVIEVVDHGRGVAGEQRQRIFERFHRANPELSGDRGGSGLGLSIVEAVIAAHGGSVRVLDTPGGGATFRVELPLRDPSPAPPRAPAAVVP
jgi:two-component system OmpR family sensor kinase